MKKRLLFFVLFMGFFVVDYPCWAIEIKMNDTREGNFYVDALNMILEKSGQEYQLILDGKDILSQARKVEEVRKGRLDILYAGTSQKLEEILLPIRFPVMRGLIGSRVFIIHQSEQAKFDTVKNLDDLKHYEGIQGLGWGDTEILEAAGLKQYSAKYDHIFAMINSGRPYYFPRGVTEVYSELIPIKEKLPNLVVEKNILLVYPTAVLFFVKPSNTELAKILTSGFLNAYEDGSYHRFFYNHPMIKRAIAQSNLGKRTTIKISNPFLTIETSAIPAEYWHQD